MDVTETSAVDDVEHERGQRRAEIAMQCGHRAGLDLALRARSHDKVVAAADCGDEPVDPAKVIGQVAVSEDRDVTAYVRDRIDVRSPETQLRHAEHARAVFGGYCGR